MHLYILKTSFLEQGFDLAGLVVVLVPKSLGQGVFWEIDD